MKSVVGWFKTRQDANQAVETLQQRGFTDREVAPAFSMTGGMKDELIEGSVIGAVGGAGLGSFLGLFVGFDLIDATVVATPLAPRAWDAFFTSLLTGMLIGAVIGCLGLIFLIWLGFNLESSSFRLRGPHQDGLLVTVEVEPGDLPQIRRIMRRSDAVEVKVTDLATHPEPKLAA